MNIIADDAAGLGGEPWAGLDGGGGLFLYNSDTTLTGNFIFDNTITFGDGGGLLLDTSAATLTGNSVYGNFCADDGGGLFLYCSGDMDVDDVQQVANLWRQTCP